MATIKDIARHRRSGAERRITSPQQQYGVKKSTWQRILEIARELG